MSWAEKWWLPVLVVSIILLILSSIFIEVNNVSTTPVWAWVVGAIAIAILITAVVFYMISLSRRVIEECDEDDYDSMERDKIIEETRIKVVSSLGETKSDELVSRKVSSPPRQKQNKFNDACGVVRSRTNRKDCDPYTRPQVNQQMRQQRQNTEAYDEEMQPRLRVGQRNE